MVSDENTPSLKRILLYWSARFFLVLLIINSFACYNFIYNDWYYNISGHYRTKAIAVSASIVLFFIALFFLRRRFGAIYSFDSFKHAISLRAKNFFGIFVFTHILFAIISLPVLFYTFNGWGGSRIDDTIFLLVNASLLKTISIVVCWIASRNFSELSSARAVVAFFITMDVIYYLLFLLGAAVSGGPGFG